MKYFPNSLFLVIVHILHKKSHDIIMADHIIIPWAD